jgi:hypothetical protein
MGRSDAHPHCYGKIQSVEPQAWLADVLRRIADHPGSQLHELLPWRWKLHETRAAAACQPPRRGLRPMLTFERHQFLLQCAHRCFVIGDQLDYPPHTMFDAIEFGTFCISGGVFFHPQAVDVSVEFLAEGLERVRLHQLAVQALENYSLKVRWTPKMRQ